MNKDDSKDAAPRSDAKHLNADAAKRIMRDVLERVRRMGAGAAALWRKLKKDRSPQAMLATLEQAAEANRTRRDGVASRTEKLYEQIVERKKAYANASPARRRILEAELSSLLAQHKAAERELTALLENERVLAQTIGRIHELTALGMAGVTELQMDDLIEEIELSVAEAEARLDAARDMEKAGRRRERSSEKESLWEDLAQFDETESAVADGGDATPPLQDSTIQDAQTRERGRQTAQPEKGSDFD